MKGTNDEKKRERQFHLMFLQHYFKECGHEANESTKDDYLQAIAKVETAKISMINKLFKSEIFKTDFLKIMENQYKDSLVIKRKESLEALCDKWELNLQKKGDVDQLVQKIANGLTSRGRQFFPWTQEEINLNLSNVKKFLGVGKIPRKKKARHRITKTKHILLFKRT